MAKLAARRSWWEFAQVGDAEMPRDFLLDAENAFTTEGIDRRWMRRGRGRPILMRFEETERGVRALPDGRVDAYFKETFEYPRQAATARKYGLVFKLWFEFLEDAEDPVPWHEATDDHVKAFKEWRLFDTENLKVVNGKLRAGTVEPDTWNDDLKALKSFYTWATQPRVNLTTGEESRLALMNPASSRFKESSAAGRARPKKPRRAPKAKYLSVEEVRLIRAVGVLGYQATLNERTGALEPTTILGSSKVQDVQRNLGLIDFAVFSGMRIDEAGGHLKRELMDIKASSFMARLDNGSPMVPRAIAKNKVTRPWTVLHRAGIDGVHAYAGPGGDRELHVRRAQRKGRYGAIPNKIIVTEVNWHPRDGLELTSDEWGGIPKRAASLDFEHRQRLYELTADGQLEPMLMWLKDSGEPLGEWGFYKFYQRVTDRLIEQRMANNLVNAMRITGHTWRHTFAVFALVVFMRQADMAAQPPRKPTDPFHIENYTHCFDRVATLLGHADPETTEHFYLEPAKSLRIGAMFNTDTIEDATSFLTTAEGVGS